MPTGPFVRSEIAPFCEIDPLIDAAVTQRNFRALHQRLNEVKQMDDKRTALTSPNWNLDLSKEVGKGYVAYVAVKEEDMLGGTPLSECQPYMAKAPSELPVDVPCLSLDRFIKAYSNPVVVTDKAQLEQQLQDRGVPRRLVLDFAFLEPEFVAECLADGILFSTE